MLGYLGDLEYDRLLQKFTAVRKKKMLQFSTGRTSIWLDCKAVVVLFHNIIILVQQNSLSRQHNNIIAVYMEQSSGRSFH